MRETAVLVLSILVGFWIAPYVNAVRDRSDRAHSQQHASDVSTVFKRADAGNAKQNSNGPPEQKIGNPMWVTDTIQAVSAAVVSAFTVRLFFVARRQARIYQQQRKIMLGQLKATKQSAAHFRAVERAYLSMLHGDLAIHGEPDGQGGQDPRRPVALTFTITLKNVGRTPGDLLGGFVSYSLGELPDRPDPARMIRFSRAFLIPNDVAFLGNRITTEKEPNLPAALLGRGPTQLWLIGEVDYRDRFGEFHTSGYGRVFTNQRPTGTPLGFSTSAEVGDLNFDRPMSEDKRRHYGGQPEYPKQ